MKVKAGIRTTLSRVFFALLILGGCSVFTSGCDLFGYKRPFPDSYYDTNFIAAIGFDQNVCTAAYTTGDPETTGQWDMVYRYNSWNGSSNYMTLDDTTQTASAFGTPPAALLATAPVWRLNLVNLINGGDFETDESARWSTTGAGLCTWSDSATLFGSYNMGSYSMKLALENAETATYTPSATVIADKVYNLFFRYTSTGDFELAVEDAPDNYPILSGIVEPAYIKLTPTVSSDGILTCIFATQGGTGYINALAVDNFRLTRSINSILRLLLLPAETSPVLIDGDYSFSVWVYTDPSAYADVAPYQIDAFTMKISQGEGSILSSVAVTYAPAAGWQKLTATTSQSSLQISDETVPVIELVIDCTQSRPGSVLLAQPELVFYPDGL